MKRFSLIVVTALLVALVAGVSVQAAVYMKQVTHTDAVQMMGQTQPESYDTAVMWYEGETARSDVDDSLTVLVFLNDQRIALLNNARKTYMYIPMNLDELVDMAPDDDAEDGADAAATKDQVKEMMNQVMGSMKVNVTKTDETKKIADWDTRKYDVEMSIMGMPMNQEMWTTEDIEIDERLYQAANGAMLSMMPGMEDVMTEMMKVKGVPVYSVMTANMMGASIKSTTELLEYKEADLPKGSFEIPSDYTEVDMRQQMMMGH